MNSSSSLREGTKLIRGAVKHQDSLSFVEKAPCNNISRKHLSVLKEKAHNVPQGTLSCLEEAVEVGNWALFQDEALS